jgi:hypothetical protein
MATTPLDHIHHGHLGAVYVSEESSFCTTGTERRCWPVADSVDVQTTQTSVPVTTLGPIPFDPETPIAGLKGATAKLGYYLQPSATVNTAGATPDTDADAPLRVLLRGVFGGESVTPGSTVASAASGSSLSVDTGHGARLHAGKLVAVDTDATYGLEVAQVRSRSTDALTLYPALSATPAGSQSVVSINTYYPTRSHSRSLSVAVSGQNTDRQVRVNGCTGSMAIELQRDALAMATFDLVGATWTGPSALSLAVTRVEDTMANPIAVRNAIVLLQPVATTTRVNTAVDSVSLALNFGNVHLTSLTGTTEGKRAVHRGENLIGPFATAELVMPDCADVYTWYEGQSELSLFVIVKVDVSASVRRFVVAHLPQCIITQRPAVSKGEGQLTKLTVSLAAKTSEQCSGTLDTEEMAMAPFLLGLG